eukprot:TRINITY_DN4670_c0_g1_i1.p1 TRINITY_DN4670_c0_g1~~TRINITY_DN4670_c0_g1_i1.p1  ORF type:complete len:292 (+),score=22.02 TRINITY_DN4670_c0_g1_i1:49-924(+)
MLPVMATFLGMTLAIFIPVSQNTQNTQLEKAVNPQKKFLISGVLEYFGQTLAILGLIYAGSGIYQVTYSSVVVFTAVFSKIFLKKELHFGHWVSISLIVSGLSLSALGTTQGHHTGNPYTQLFGMFLTLAASIFYASNYVLVEWILSGPSPPQANSVQTYSGLYALGFTLIYIVFYTVPHFDTIIVQSINAKNGNFQIIILMYCLMVLSAFLHSYTYYWLINNVGAVATGVLQSVRAISVFALSSMFFCSEHDEQCYNLYKAIATVVVVCGLAYYSHVKTVVEVKPRKEGL